MSDEILIDAAGNPQPLAASVPVPVIPQTTVTPPPTAAGDNWQARFTGLQRSLQDTLQLTGWGKLDAIPKQVDVTAWQQAATELPSLRTQYEATVQEKVTLEASKAALTARTTELERQVRKYSLVAEKAPQAIALADYIPVTPDDETQVAAITQFLSRLGSATPNVPVGTLPPGIQPATGGSGLTAVDVFAQMQAALATNNMVEYDRLREIWANL